MNIKRENNIAIVDCGDLQSSLTEWGQLFEQLDSLKCPAIIDTESVQGDLTEIDAFLLAMKIDEMSDLRHQRVAFVVRGDVPGDLAFFILSGKNLGLAMKSFDCINTATAWVRGRGQQLSEGASLAC